MEDMMVIGPWQCVRYILSRRLKVVVMMVTGLVIGRLRRVVWWSRGGTVNRMAVMMMRGGAH